ncbi:hypothetical protein ACQHMR_00850 [Escherichia coli]|uniref:hypothetical protein n=1 Tax=Escherichia coli TaxID=562 RepID=UPI003CE9ACF0
MFGDKLELPRNGRIVLYISDYKVTKAEVLEPEKHLVTLPDIIELYKRVGYVDLHRDDVPVGCMECEHRRFEVD